MNFQVIEKQDEFDELCKRLSESDWVGFDTEFCSDAIDAIKGFG